MERRWTRRRTEIAGDRLADDWCVRCDGLIVGRVSLTRGGPQDGRWRWAVQTLPGSSGHEATLEAARAGVAFGADGRPDTVDVLKERAAARWRADAR